MELSYERLKENLKDNLKRTEKFVKINDILKNYDSFFIHPYIQNYKINSLIKKEAKGELNQEKVSFFFIKEFYDLSLTVSAVDGFFKESKYINPYLYNIERSLILCFQKEYAGAINIMIPCIEGVITQYLCDKEILTDNYDRYKKVRSFLKKIYEELSEENTKYINESNTYNHQQKKYLASLERKELDNWIKLLDYFLNQTLFAHSKSTKAPLNRHVIFHALKTNKYDTIENYIKLFNCLIFINWFLAKVENRSILDQMDSIQYLFKRSYYEKIIKLTEKITPYKNMILEEYPNHSQVEFLRKIKHKSILKDIGRKPRIIFKFLLFFKWLKYKISVKTVDINK